MGRNVGGKTDGGNGQSDKLMKKLTDFENKMQTEMDGIKKKELQKTSQKYKKLIKKTKALVQENEREE